MKEFGTMRKKAGFTLTEIVIVIAVLGLLAAVGVPSYLRYVPKYRLRSAARDLYSNLNLAKMAAIKTNQKSRVNYRVNPDQYTVSLLKKTVILKDYGSGVKFEGPNKKTFAVDTITFNSRGTSNSGYAYLSNSGNTDYYRVGPLTSGAIKLQRWSKGAWK
jgi:prepilin-type N-terminal cleavage/methylation domain-containing protein